MSKRMKILHGLIILAILGGAFYWFQWRPTQIRKECQRNLENTEYREALEKKIELKMGGAENTDLYQNCLREHGLEK